MRDIFFSKILADLPSQFKEKPKIQGLIAVFSMQLDEIYTVLQSLLKQRTLKSATGHQLDKIGEIVSLSRKEAAELARTNKYVDEDVDDLDDEMYRRYIYYKIWLNTCKSTYQDMMKSLKLFWEHPLYYSENIDTPATIFLSTGESLPEEHAEKLLSLPIVRPAGVRILLTVITRNPNITVNIPFSPIIGRMYASTKLPEL